MTFDTLWWYLLVGGNILVWSRIVGSIIGLVTAGVMFAFAMSRR